jgi:hypothetical protein
MPDGRPRLFISHSSKDVALTEAVAAALKVDDPPRHPGFEVLVDKDALQAGEDWPIQLHAMMAYADAGLLLFTRAAMKRPDWIRKEAYILTWRRSLDPSFKVFYTYLDDVKDADLTAGGFAPAHLNLIQRLQATEAAAIAAEVRGLTGARLQNQTPYEELVFYLSQHLKQLDPAALDLLADQLGAPAVAWWQPKGVSPGLARIAARMLAGQFGSVATLSTLVNKLKALDVGRSSLKILLRWVAPYWLPPETAGRLGAVIDGLWTNGQGGWASLNGNEVMAYTAKMFVYRARPFAFNCRVARIENPSHAGDANFYKKQICKWLRNEDNRLGDDERIGYSDDDDDVVAQVQKQLPFLFVPLRTPDEPTLKKLRDMFPTVIFLLWTGKDLEPIDYDLPVIPLEPPVDRGRETTELQQWQSALQALTG